MMMRSLLSLLLVLGFASCSSHEATKPADMLIGAKFPKVEGTSLEGASVTLPEDLAEATVILVGYVQDAQFDIDRWMLGLLQADVAVPMVEVPTIAGIIPRFVSDKINMGMKRGIPRENWEGVVTVYEDADKIISVLGNENPRNARVVLVDASGTIKYFHDKGFSPSEALALATLAEETRD